jgi:hypothetical protein
MKDRSTTERNRTGQYIDSPMMTHRLRHGRKLAARIQGNYGAYRTQAAIRGRNGWCSCPSERWPCKHVVALKHTWKTNPGSFFDLSTVLNDLASKSKPDLLAAIGNMALQSPESLSALGIDAFDTEENEAAS